MTGITTTGIACGYWRAFGQISPSQGATPVPNTSVEHAMKWQFTNGLALAAPTFMKGPESLGPNTVNPQWWGTSMFSTRLTSSACAINNSGFIVGYIFSAYNDPGYPKAVVWDPEGNCETLDVCVGSALAYGEHLSYAFDINDDNLVIAQKERLTGGSVKVALRLPFAPRF
jgi:uncharacterized membrane protein